MGTRLCSKACWSEWKESPWPPWSLDYKLNAWLHDLPGTTQIQGFSVRGGACTYPSAPQFVLLILYLCGRSDQPCNSAKLVLARKEPKVNKNALKSEWLQQPRQRCNYFALVVPCLVSQDLQRAYWFLSSKIIWKERALCYERGEKLCVTVSSVRSKSYNDFPCPDDAGLVCSSVSKAQVSAALRVLQSRFPFNFAVKNV